MNKITDSRLAVSIEGQFARLGTDEAPVAVKAYTEYAAELSSQLRAFEAQVSAVEADPTLSHIGRVQRKEELHEAAVGALDGGAAAKLDRADRLFRDQVEEIQRRIGRAIEPPTEPAAVAVASDIRRHVAGLSRTERSRFLSQNAANAEVAAAILAAPPFLSGLSADELEAYRDQVVEALLPAEAAKLKVLRQANEAAKRVRNVAASMLSERVGGR